MPASSNGSHAVERLSRAVTRFAGSSYAFGAALLVVLLWLASGPLFRWSDTWQLVVNTGTTVVTFLMVFLLQRAQNKDARALHLKLNEIVAVMEGASNRLLNVEDLSEAELQALHAYYGELYRLAKRDRNLSRSHSVEEARGLHRLHYGEPDDDAPPRAR